MKRDRQKTRYVYSEALEEIQRRAKTLCQDGYKEKTKMVENPNGEWVKWEDIKETLNEKSLV